MSTESGGNVDGSHYGAFAMEWLINGLIRLGATRKTLEAKVFGGGTVLGSTSGTNIGERNTRFVLDDLRAERIDVTGQDVLDVVPRKVCFMPASGKAMVKRLERTNFDTITAQELAAATRARPIAAGGGAIDLFAGACPP